MPTPNSLPPISAEYRQFVLDHAPRFATAVDNARKRGGEAATTLRAFRDNPFLLYAALWYAASEGVSVTFNAPTRI
ncbi:MAG: hypothetical protein ACRYFS_19740 [Janthinobacterium lividum]